MYAGTRVQISRLRRVMVSASLTAQRNRAKLVDWPVTGGGIRLAVLTFSPS